MEGKGAGMETELVRMLGSWDGIPITYAGGIGSMEDLERFRKESGGKVDFTIGSALDLFGGKIPYAEVCSYCHSRVITPLVNPRMLTLYEVVEFAGG